MDFKPEYRKLNQDEINIKLFSQFCRRQVVTDCWRREGDAWVIKADPFTDDWRMTMPFW